MHPHKLLVLRHGQTEWNAVDRLQGKLDSPLTPQGIADAERQRDLLATVDLAGLDLWVSPQGRARHTAEIALGPAASRVRVDDRLREIDVGDWSGAHRSEILAQHPHLTFEEGVLGWYDHAPGGEGLAALEARAASFLADLGRPAVLITHGITSRMLRVLALGWNAERFAELPGGQGNVHIVEEGRHETLA